MAIASIVGAAKSVPKRKLDNMWFEQLLGESVDTWLTANLTIRTRYWCADDESTASLCVQAAAEVLEQCRRDRDSVDLILVATDTPEYLSPATATVVQDRLGARRAVCFDLNNACAGFVTALDVAARMLTGPDRSYRSALVIGAYAMSRFLDLQDKKTVTLFADGAGAVLLERCDDDQHSGYLGSLMRCEGQYHDWMGVYAGGAAKPVRPGEPIDGDFQLRFRQKFPRELNPNIWSEMIPTVLAQHGLALEQVRMFLFTQIDIRSIAETMRRLGLSMDRSHTIMDCYGYTGSACIPMALADAMGKGLVGAGDLVVLMGSGAGLSFASAVLRL